MKSIKTYNAFRARLNEEEKWAQDVKVKQGKMTKMLDIPEGKTVTDVYEGNPKKLAEDLFKACWLLQEMYQVRNLIFSLKLNKS